MRVLHQLLSVSLFTTLALLPTPANHAASPALRSDLQIENKQWHLEFFATREAHRISRGDGVIVAVLDTGVSPHPDLRDNLLPGVDLTSQNPDQGGHDRDGHGTGMAGLIAAHGRPGDMGTLGIAPAAKLLPVRFKEYGSEGTAERLARAIEYAIRQRSTVISISSTGGADPRLQRAIQTAAHADVVVVAAAGNRPDDLSVGYPAAYPSVIAVGGVDQDGSHAKVSVTGPDVDVVAPAVDLVSTNFDGGYRVGTGTSGAAAIVAGAAALVRAKFPYLPADEVVHRLTATAIDKGPPGRDDQYGYGVIDLVAALTADVPPRGFGPGSTAGPDGTGPTTAAADGPRGGGERAATVRGLVTLGVLVAAGVTWVLFIRRRRRSDDPPPRITR
ncbi:type VII secretion-associated serine protease mycosin [Micromonospora andamanensis]|uniref:type VII secretion-associated serine protease mycosin n=1 Tax=Micromonospora andamanensis TaxID=1287068 RepID=UPI0019521374|nr:type VII secretion-associated serine protease mycosin [Micromonospora andamanensis]